MESDSISVLIHEAQLLTDTSLTIQSKISGGIDSRVLLGQLLSAVWFPFLHWRGS